MAKGSIVKNLIVGVAGGVIALGGGIGYEALTGGNLSTGTTSTSSVNYKVNTSTTSAIKKVSNAVVSVLNYQSGSSNNTLQGILGGNSSSSGTQLASEGSGVIYKKSGGTAYIVTNNHVVAGASSIDILMASGQKVPATVVGTDSFSDLAVLKISSQYVKEVATFGKSSDLQVGEPAIAVGSPLGSEFANTATEGIISSLARQVSYTNDEGQQSSINALQTDAAINPGNSGGALINIEGQVIGITSSKISTSTDGSTSVEGMGFAIPSDDAINIINKLETGAQVTRPALGISMADLSTFSSSQLSQLHLPSNVTSGVFVASVQSGLPADKAGLKANDVITKIGDTEVTSGASLQSALYKYNVGDDVKVTYYRNGSQHTASVHLTANTNQLQSSQTQGSN